MDRMSQGAAVAVRELFFAAAALIAPRRSVAAIERRQLAGVNAMLAAARADVAHYGDPAYAGHLRRLPDLAGLPIVTKAQVRAAPERFHAPERGWFQTDTTAGSTGSVLRVRHDAGAYGYHGATLLRRFLRAGCRPWWTIAHLKPFPRPSRWFQRFGIFRRTVVHAGLPERELAEAILALRPRVLMGYPVMLRAVLRELTGDELARLRRSLRLILSESELLTAETRALLGEGFGVPVRDEYSAFEVLTIATECRHGSMHVDADRVVFEVVDPADGRPVPPGTPGVAVVTHFRERAMPLVRYRIDDRVAVVPGACPCGSRFGRMRLLDGRIEDSLVLRDGTVVYFGAFAAVTLKQPGIAEFSVRQDEAGEVTVSLQLDPAAGLGFDEVCDGVRGMLRDLLGFDLPLHFRRIDRLELTPGGKARLVRSRFRPGAPGSAAGPP
ncbi:phenylacetate--CoA ligase family protein [Dactylosporangium sp. CA-052675]|uniref:phenylacetate--CoA ligase family protein n=1 Tax=Dactylosporangium sp. CA-052675 TaxID=3239927 RepID=UPI003D9496C1